MAWRRAAGGRWAAALKFAAGMREIAVAMAEVIRSLRSTRALLGPARAYPPHLGSLGAVAERLSLSLYDLMCSSKVNSCLAF